MAKSDGMTLTDKQPPPKSLAAASQVKPGTPTDCVLNPRLGERIESLKTQVESILNDTEWPSESKDAANDLLNTVKSSPDIPNSPTSISQELHGLVEQYIRTLEDVRSRLKDASSKSGMQRWKVLQRVKSLASKRSSKCTLLFQTCQDDVSKVVFSFNEGLENERKKAEDLVATGVLPESHTQRNLAPAGKTGAATFNVQTTSSDSTSGASPAQHPPSSVHENMESRSQFRAEALTIARKTFKGVEIASGSIPVVGNYGAPFVSRSPITTANLRSTIPIDDSD